MQNMPQHRTCSDPATCMFKLEQVPDKRITKYQLHMKRKKFKLHRKCKDKGIQIGS